MGFAISVWHPIASIVTKAPEISMTCRGFEMVVISVRTHV